MSYKAYCVRVRTEEEILNLKKYTEIMKSDAYVSNIYQYEINLYSFKEGDFVIALTAEVPNLYQSMKEEIGKHKKLYSRRLDLMAAREIEGTGKFMPVGVKQVEFKEPTDWANELIEKMKEKQDEPTNK